MILMLLNTGSGPLKHELPDDAYGSAVSANMYLEFDTFFEHSWEIPN